jgi:ubiquinone/menaquinone biosynthesis C-methylase UbiE
MSTKFTHTWEQAVCWLREQPEKQELVRCCYYDDPLESAAQRFSNSEEWLAVKNLLSQYIPGKVLDLGAGRGISSYAFAKLGCSVTALEPDSSPLVGAQAIQSLVDSTQLPIQIIQEYGETLPFEDNTFDIVYGRAVLHHAYDLKKLCQETARVLKPGGVLIATREHIISKKEDLPLFLASHPLHFLYGGENAYLLQEYLEAIETARLKLQKAIAPFECVINYAPMTQQDFSNLIKSVLAPIIGDKLGNWLANNETVQKFCGWYQSQKSDTPGRHYSFIAIKP